jgi:hypothetical protein
MNDMTRLLMAFGGAGLAILVLVATVAAATPTTGPARVQGADGTITTILGLSQAQVQELRADGLSLAQIAERQKVDPQKLVDALAAQWTERIEARVAAGAITTAQATELKSQVQLRAKDMVYKTTTGGMRGVAVGAGPGNAGRMGAGMGQRGTGTGTGTCDGTGPHGAGRP